MVPASNVTPFCFLLLGERDALLLRGCPPAFPGDLLLLRLLPCGDLLAERTLAFPFGLALFPPLRLRCRLGLFPPLPALRLRERLFAGDLLFERDFERPPLLDRWRWPAPCFLGDFDLARAGFPPVFLGPGVPLLFVLGFITSCLALGLDGRLC